MIKSTPKCTKNKDKHVSLPLLSNTKQIHQRKKIKSDNGNKTYPWSNRGGEISLEYKTSKRYFINCEKENIKITNPR